LLYSYYCFCLWLTINKLFKFYRIDTIIDIIKYLTNIISISICHENCIILFTSYWWDSPTFDMFIIRYLNLTNTLWPWLFLICIFCSWSMIIFYINKYQILFIKWFINRATFHKTDLFSIKFIELDLLC
jgi:hypothetical protein